MSHHDVLPGPSWHERTTSVLVSEGRGGGDDHREHPEAFTGKGISEIADYEQAIIRRLDRKPVIVAGWRDVAEKALEFVKRFA
jgi:hypothetical protein